MCVVCDHVECRSQGLCGAAEEHLLRQIHQINVKESVLRKKSEAALEHAKELRDLSTWQV